MQFILIFAPKKVNLFKPILTEIFVLLDFVIDLATLVVMETRCRRFDGVHCDSFYQFGDLSCMRQFVVNVSATVPSSIPFHRKILKA